MTFSKTFKSEKSDLEAEVIDRWIILKQGENTISLGKPENTRIEIIETAISFARNKKEKIK